jgi:hypothetical protein
MAAEHKASKDDVLQMVLDAHARREKRNIDGQGHEYYIYDRCPLCDAARQALGIDEEEFEVVEDSSPTTRIEDADKAKAAQSTAARPKLAEGDETPAGYLGYDGPKPAAPRTEGAGTTTLDQQPAKLLDPKMAGPEAQRAEQDVRLTDAQRREREAKEREDAQRKQQQQRRR